MGPAEVGQLRRPDFPTIPRGESILHALETNAKQMPKIPFLGPRQKVAKWRELGADPVLIRGIKKGVQAPIHKIPQESRPPPIFPDPALMETIGQYLQDGVIKALEPEKAKKTKTWTPIFPVPKKDSGKIRVITDLRKLNEVHRAPRFRADTWATTMQVLRDPNLKWGLTLDLKSWFHHLMVNPRVQRWMRFKVGGRAFQIVAMPFGWNLSPWWSNKLSKPVRAWMQAQRMPHVWYVDDILILGSSREEAEGRALRLIAMLTELGVAVNPDKSMKGASQQLNYLGMELDLVGGWIRTPKEKTEVAIKMTKHLLSAKTMIPKILARLAGTLLDQEKGNVQLHGLPKQLMKHAGLGVIRNKVREPWAHIKRLWGRATKLTNNAREILKESLQALQELTPRVLRPPPNAEQLVIQSDACETGWGARLLRANREVSSIAQTWDPQEAQAHITHLEARASALGVQWFIPKIAPGAHVTVHTDSTSAVWCWRKGSRLRGMNQEVRKAVVQANEKGLWLECEHIPGVKNTRADWLSRNPDHQSYRLAPNIFHAACQHFRVSPTLDLFANRHNRQLPRFCAWRLDPLSEGNAFAIRWSRELAWMNPPWALIPKCLAKVHHDKARVLACVPVWKSAHWWRELLDMAIAPPWVWKRCPMFQDPAGKWMPPPRWDTAFILLQGSGHSYERSKISTTFPPRFAYDT